MTPVSTITLAEQATLFYEDLEDRSSSRSFTYRVFIGVCIICSWSITAPLALIQTVFFGCLRLVALVFGKTWGKESLASSIRAVTYFNFFGLVTISGLSREARELRRAQQRLEREMERIEQQNTEAQIEAENLTAEIYNLQALQTVRSRVSQR